MQVVIVGGGIGGLTTAISLAKKGNEYLVNNFSFDIAIARLEEYFRQSLS